MPPQSKTTEPRKPFEVESNRVASRRAKTAQKPSCAGCPFLLAKERTDFYPARPEFWCRLTGLWIGFASVTPEWCLPVINRNEVTHAH